MSDEPTEKIVRTDEGYRVTIYSKRGTGTRDQDQITVEYRSEQRPSLPTLQTLCEDVRKAMDMRREHKPDQEDEDNE